MEKYTISKEYLDQITDEFAKCLVGKCMKRFELYDNKNQIKKAVKELIYENTRDLKVAIRAFSYGIKFNTSSKQR